MRAALTLLVAAGLAWASGVRAQPAAGDPAKGETIFQDRCGFCHVLEGPGQGPNLIGVVGRKAAGDPAFTYSPALKASGLTWSAGELDRFLTGPTDLVPGTSMRATIFDPAERRDLIAYLASLKGK
ncbi:MAG: c-type cytochrome [Caulobacteraceae bacterium]|nr:c-type cytochrome [Caulobacteraceae bacterium]